MRITFDRTYNNRMWTDRKYSDLEIDNSSFRYIEEDEEDDSEDNEKGEP